MLRMRPVQMVAMLVLGGAVGACSDRAEAQTGVLGPNTYADVPFNQGSLFYRPSGARNPATARRPATKAPANRARRGLFRRRRANPAPVYYSYPYPYSNQPPAAGNR